MCLVQLLLQFRVDLGRLVGRLRILLWRLVIEGSLGVVDLHGLASLLVVLEDFLFVEVDVCFVALFVSLFQDAMWLGGVYLLGTFFVCGFNHLLSVIKICIMNY